jgi:hypothetical protein
LLTKQLEQQAAGSGSGFAPGAVYPSTDRSGVPSNLMLFGSWLGTDAATGSYRSPWFEAETNFYLFISGYPNAPGNSLVIEIENPDGSIQEMRLILTDAREVWVPRRVVLHASGQAARMRIVATDNNDHVGGWFGFSQPFKLKSRLNLTGMAQVARIILAVAAALTLVLGPGFVLRIKLKQLADSTFPFALVFLPGIFLLLICGLITWRFFPDGKAQWLAAAFFVPILLLMFVSSYRTQGLAFFSQHERRALLILVVLVSVAVAKASYSLGPTGELFGGTVSRTLEVGDRSDSRIPYHVVQLVAHGTNPYSELGKSYFAPWSFSHRGPLAGIAASPIVFLSGAQVPQSMPDQSWSPFDKEGFAAYRIVMIVMAATCLLVLFDLVAYLSGPPAGLFALLFAGLSPFVVHELFFTWPKLLAASIVLMAFLLLIRKHLVYSGVMMGFAYLCHPLALFSLPALMLVWLMLIWRKHFDRKEATSVVSSIDSLMLRELVLQLVLLIVPMATVFALWYIINGNNFQQGRFLEYFITTEGHRVSSFSEWVSGRISSLANTLIPFYLYLNSPEHHSINSISGPSPNIVRFYFQYWNTLPFGVGITYFVVFLYQLWRGARRFPGLFLATIGIPFFIFAAFWGEATSGMMREGLHIWFFSLVIFIVWSWPVSGRDFRSSKWHSVLFALRALEVFLMLLLPAVLTRQGFYKEMFLFSDIVALSVMSIGLGWLARQCYLASRSLSYQSSARLTQLFERHGANDSLSSLSTSL